MSSLKNDNNKFIMRLKNPIIFQKSIKEDDYDFKEYFNQKFYKINNNINIFINIKKFFNDIFLKSQINITFHENYKLFSQLDYF